MSAKWKAALSSYARSFIAAALAVYAASEDINWRGMLAAGLSAIVPPIIRALNGADPAFGFDSEDMSYEYEEEVA